MAAIFSGSANGVHIIYLWLWAAQGIKWTDTTYCSLGMQQISMEVGKDTNSIQTVS